MTVNTTTSSTTQIGNGATTVWNYSFYIPDALDVVVKITQLSTGNVTTLSSSQYTITGLGDAAGGTVTYSPALSTDHSITIARVLPVVQGTSLSNQGALYPVVIEDALDYLTMICQQMTATYNRAVTAPLNDVETSLVLPVKALRAEKLMGFDVNGSPTYYPVGDSTSASIINFTQAGTGAVTRSVQSKMQDVLSVKDFGATGDGTTDDTTAVQACITAAALANRAVYIPGGAYKLSAQLVYSGRTVSIYGDGPEVTELFWTAAAGSTGILVTLAKIGSFSVNFNIRGLSLTTLKTVSGTAIRVVGTTTYDDRVSTRAIIKDLVIRGRTNPTTDGWLIGVDLDATPRCYVEDVNFIGKVNGSEPNYSSTYGIRYGNFSSATIQPTEVMVHACIVSYAQNAMYFSDMEGALLTSCQIVGVNNGVTFTAASARPHGSVIGCHINASAAAVLVVSMYEVVLSSNLFYLQNATADGVGVDVSGSAGYFTINNNVFENYNNAWACNSIVISSGTKGTISSNIFRRSDSIDTTRTGTAIWLTAGSSYCTISNDNTFGIVTTFILDSGSNNVNLFTSAAITFTQAGSGAVSRTLTSKLRDVVSVKDFGAVGDNNGTTGNGTNDRAAIQAAITYALTVGAEVYVPAGRYRVGSGLTADMSAVSATVQFHFSMRGDGAGQSMFIYDTGAINGLTVTGPSATVPAETYFRMNGIGMIKNDALGSGLVLNRSAYASVDNCNFIAWQNNVYALDFLSCSFRRVNCRFGTYGIVAEYLAFSRPSALSFFDCEVSNNSEIGYKITNGSNINIYGGGVQGNGIGGVTGTRGGVLMVGGPLEGSSGLAMYGTYLEGNNGEADIYISNSDYPGTYNFYGLTIQRNNVLPAVNFCTNNILVEGSSVMRINVNGCSFRARNDYVQNSGRPYINIVTPATTTLVLGQDNYFTPGVDNILPAGDHFTPASYPRAYWYGDTTGPTATYQKGTASVTKNGTGDITITYSATLLSATNFPQLQIVGGAGYISVTSQSTTTIRIVRNNAAGTPTDGLVSVAIYGL